MEIVLSVINHFSHDLMAYRSASSGLEYNNHNEIIMHVTMRVRIILFNTLNNLCRTKYNTDN